ncbi:haloacid dehalogenase-like hydrolase domain-containing protein 2 [Halyomorpha halys]|uniref:haloacid dehalogenase-like hydrolase domain-containing protein 2 n=1 Tax=Halyomorpha halys TaxID=286706 RepID=UPI0006D4F6DB|nr:haloacid dehalogenase-like hydrolase domain-containing protein 2 [Halyomorpha halys]
MAFRSNLKSVLIDLSGTLHIENEVTPNAIEALNRLRSTNLKIKFVTNTTKESRRILHERLTKLGFDIKQDEIFTSLWAARDLVKKESLRPMYFLDDAAMEDFEGFKSEDNINAVVIGLAPDKFNWNNLTKAFRLLLNGAKLIAIHAARYYKSPDGLSLGPGPFVKALEYASGTEASIVGKPASNFFCAALDKVKPTEAVMIGDDVRDDVGGAQALGMKGYLVKTGKYRDNDENKIDPAPYKTVNNFSEAVDDIISSLNDSS